MVKIYTKEGCPFCENAKNLFDSLNVKYEEIDISGDSEMMQELSQKSGMMTVPQVFVGDKCLGGYSDIKELNDKGELMDKLV